MSTADALYQHNYVGQQLIFMSTVHALYELFFISIVDTLSIVNAQQLFIMSKSMFHINSKCFISTVNASSQQLLTYVNRGETFFTLVKNNVVRPH